MNGFTLTGTRAIAIVEAVKSILILAAGCGLLSLLHRDLESLAIQSLDFLHVDAERKYPHLFLESARHLTDSTLFCLAVIALADAVVRGVEAYGLWHESQWAKWLGIVAGSIYLPFEIVELGLGASALKVGALLVNIAIVAYLGYDLRYSHVHPTQWEGVVP